MNTYTTVARRTLALATVFVGLGMGGIAVAQDSALLMKDATTDEVYFAQKTLRISDTRLAKLQVTTNEVVTETTSNRFERITFYRATRNSTAVIGESVLVDLGKTGTPTAIMVTMRKGAAAVAAFQRVADGSWVITSLYGGKDRVLIVPTTITTFDANSLRANGALFGALEQIDRADVLGRKYMKFMVTSFTADTTSFTIAPVDINGNPVPWKVYTFVGGELQ